jgi:hypothetical protein
MKAGLRRSKDAHGRPEPHITLAGTCDESAVRTFARQVKSGLGDGPVRRVVVDTTNLEFDLSDQAQVNLAVDGLTRRQSSARSRNQTLDGQRKGSGERGAQCI